MNGFGFVPTPTQTNRKPNSYYNIFYQNVRGLRTKTIQFLSLLESSGSDFFAITESGLNEAIKNAELVLPDYQILRCDRADGRKQGGVCLVATPRFELRRVSLPGDLDIDSQKYELLCVAIYKQNCYLFTCCIIYIPPGADDNEYLSMFSVLEKICVKYSNNLIVLGDFNMYSCNNNICNYYEYFMAFCEFNQCNAVPNCKNRQLDLVLSARSGVSVSAADEGLEPVDAYHPPLAVRVARGARAPPPPSLAPLASPASPHKRQSLIAHTNWNFSKADFDQMYSLLAKVDWSEIYESCDPDIVLDLFYNKVYDVLDQCVPPKSKHINSPNNRYVYPVWYTAEIIKAIKVKYLLHKKYKLSKSHTDYMKFARYRARVKTETACAHNQYCNRVQGHLAKDPRAFWGYIRSRKGDSNQRKLIRDGRVLSQDECAKEFALFFQSVYNPEPPVLSVAAASASEAASAWPGARVHLASLGPADVKRALARLPPKRSAGPDGIPAYIFRDCRAVLVEPLLHLFNICIRTATFPERWKLTRVVPVPKSSKGSTPSDYRPVAVLCTPAKVFESTIHGSLYPQISALLSDAQHGFRPGRGTAGNLLDLMTQVVPTVDAGQQVDVAYFDFRKAFDIVDNDVLLAKLAGVGCTPHTLSFFASYLRDRCQYVDCSGQLSEPYFTRSGVGQGSNLGPFLFILTTNDLPRVVNKSIPLLFADDLKLVHKIKQESDHNILQQDIDRVVEWSRSNKMYFNVAKCSVLSFTRARDPSHYQYCMDGIQLQRVSEVKDLGVSFTADLNFRKHTTDVCKKAYRNLGLVLRLGNQFSNIRALRALYEALVRSHMEGNAVVWSPHETKYKLMLERIQNKFLRFLYLKQYGVYPGYPLLYPTLFVLGMVGYNKLEVRREGAVATYVFKIMRGKIHNPSVLNMVGLCVPDGYVGRRRRPPLLREPPARTNLLQHAPLTRALRTLNMVSQQIDCFNCTLSEFTRAAFCVITLGLE